MPKDITTGGVDPQQLMKDKLQVQIDQGADVQEVKTDGERLYSLGTMKQAVSYNEEYDGQFFMPIFKRAGSLPEISDIKKPSEKDVIKAHEEVGLQLKTNSFRHPRRITRAAAKTEIQKKILKKSSEGKYSVDQTELEISLGSLSQLDLTELMFDDSKKSSDENLAEHYHTLKKTFIYIDEYERDLKEEKERKKDVQGIDRSNLLKREAHLKALKDVRTYYQLIEDMALNKYYALLPREGMMKLTYVQLRQRLEALYGKEKGDRNEELINYYQSLIRIKELGLKDGKSIAEREDKYFKELKDDGVQDNRNPAEEMKKIAAAYGSLCGKIYKKRDFYTSGHTAHMKADYFDTFGKDIEKFRDQAKGDEAARLLRDYDEYIADKDRLRNKDDVVSGLVDDNISDDVEKLEARSTELPGLRLTEAQNEGMRQIQGFLMRRGWQSKNDMDGFVKALSLAPPEQRLVAFYLVESGRESSSIGADMYTAIHDYIPNVDKFRTKMKLHFWGGTNWGRISKALQEAKRMGPEIKKYAEYKNLSEGAEDILKDPVIREQDKEQGKYFIQVMTYHEIVLRQMYRTSGLSFDMPIDMAENPKLRARMYAEYNRVREMSQKMLEYIEEHPELETGMDVKLNDSIKSKLAETQSPSSLNLVCSMIKDKVKNNFELQDTSLYTETEEIALLSESGIKYYNIAKTGVERGLQGIIGAPGNAVSSAMAGMSMSANIVTLGIKCVRLGQAVNSGKDIKLTRNKLKTRVGSRKKTKDEKKLQRFLDHRERQAGRKVASAGLDLAIGFVNTVSLAMTMTGALATVGTAGKWAATVIGFVYNNTYDKSKKKQHMKAAVDEYLGTDGLIEKMRQNSNIFTIKKHSKDEIRDFARNQALGKLGYTSYKECFADVCRQFARLIHTKVFGGASESMEEWDIYNTALGSLGFRKAEYKKKYGENPQPSVKVIMAKIME